MSVVVVFSDQRDIGFGTPHKAAKPLLGTHDLRRCGFERRFMQHHLVARRHLGCPVASVERFGPHQRCRVGGSPCKITWPQRFSVNRYAVCKRQRCDVLHLYR